MMEWTECKNCIYFDDCENKENYDGCYCGEREESLEEMRGRRYDENTSND